MEKFKFWLFQKDELFSNVKSIQAHHESFNNDFFRCGCNLAIMHTLCYASKLNIQNMNTLIWNIKIEIKTGALKKICIFTDLDETSQIDSSLIDTHFLKILINYYVCDWFYSRSKFDAYTRPCARVKYMGACNSFYNLFLYPPVKLKDFD